MTSHLFPSGFATPLSLLRLREKHYCPFSNWDQNLCLGTWKYFRSIQKWTDCCLKHSPEVLFEPSCVTASQEERERGRKKKLSLSHPVSSCAFRCSHEEKKLVGQGFYIRVFILKHCTRFRTQNPTTEITHTLEYMSERAMNKLFSKCSRILTWDEIN